MVTEVVYKATTFKQGSAARHNILAAMISMGCMCRLSCSADTNCCGVFAVDPGIEITASAMLGCVHCWPNIGVVTAAAGL